MTQFKDKSERQDKNINAGLLTYPILQAADILLYKGTLVPVGQDQVQHVELTRDTARWFNNRYGEYFPETKPLLTEIPKVMSLLEPTKKMSKSLGEGHVIELCDEPDMVDVKLKKAVTATHGGYQAPGVENLLMLLKQFGDASAHKKFVAAEKDKTIRYGELKTALAEAVSNYFADFRDRRKALLDDEKKLVKILEEGLEKAQKVAQKTISETKKMIGLL
jgi:tryptophanyl-tRNA synthetase